MNTKICKAVSPDYTVYIDRNEPAEVVHDIRYYLIGRLAEAGRTFVIKRGELTHVETRQLPLLAAVDQLSAEINGVAFDSNTELAAAQGFQYP